MSPQAPSKQILLGVASAFTSSFGPCARNSRCLSWSPWPYEKWLAQARCVFGPAEKTAFEIRVATDLLHSKIEEACQRHDGKIFLLGCMQNDSERHWTFPDLRARSSKNGQSLSTMDPLRACQGFHLRICLLTSLLPSLHGIL